MIKLHHDTNLCFRIIRMKQVIICDHIQKRRHLISYSFNYSTTIRALNGDTTVIITNNKHVRLIGLKVSNGRPKSTAKRGTSYCTLHQVL
jgi:hypothetical protein